VPEGIGWHPQTSLAVIAEDMSSPNYLPSPMTALTAPAAELQTSRTYAPPCPSASR